MTDYVAQLNSQHKWMRDESLRCANNLYQESTITDGVVRWNSNNSVPPADVVALAAHIGLPVDVAKCDAARDAEISAFLVEYKRSRAQRTPEQIAEEHAEARAAHGPGVVLVNVLTGEKYTT